MDWIKVKVKHFDYDMADASDTVYKLWISAMIYTAVIEKMPSEEQLDRRLTPEGHKNLKKYLSKIGVKLGMILGKVLEDVEHIKAKRRHNREYFKSSESRLSAGRQVGKIREDKIREDKSVSFDPKVCELIKNTLKDKSVGKV